MLRVINDLHIGAERSAGTTVSTRWALRQSILTQFRALLPDNDLMILGDLFDGYNVAIHDVLRTYEALQAWLSKGHRLCLVAGNHDLSKTSNIMSSFDFLGYLLQGIAPTQITIVKQPQMTPYGYVIPHLANQTLFDEAMLHVPSCKVLYLHVNYSNFFATQSDQSLNLSKEQADLCKAEKIIIAHEHSFKQAGKVLLPGNQIASSVADWLGIGTKYHLEVEAEGTVRIVEYVERTAEYIEQNWAHLEKSDYKFVRVVGDATAEQASQVVSAISKFRTQSDSLVISNAVQIESAAGLGDFADNLESVQAFDVWRALTGVMTSEDMAILGALE